MSVDSEIAKYFKIGELMFSIQFSDVSESSYNLIARSRLTDTVTPNYICLFTLITMSTISSFALDNEKSSIFRRPSFKKTVKEKEQTKSKQRRPSLKTCLRKLKSIKNTTKMAGRPKATSSKSPFHEVPELQIVATASQDGSEIEAATSSEIFTQAPPYVRQVFENYESPMSQEEITDTQEITTQAPRAKKLQDYSPVEISVRSMEGEVSIQTVDLADTEVDKLSSKEGGNDKMEYTECVEEEYVEEKEIEAATASETFTHASPYVQQEITDTQEITAQAPRARKLQYYSPEEISVLLMEEEVSIQIVDLADTEVDKVSSEEMEYDEEGENGKMEYSECDEEEYVEEKELDIRGCEAPDALALCMLGSLIAVQFFAQ
jgi:hypothetical protein